MHIVAANKELGFKYEIIDTYICGMELKGTEVKSIRVGNVNLKDGFALVKDGQVFLKNVYIAPFDKASYNNAKERRDIKLLLHKAEIMKILGKVSQDGLTLVPSKIGFEKDKAKLELALCKGKKLYDKRESIKKREANLNIQRAMKG